MFLLQKQFVISSLPYLSVMHEMLHVNVFACNTKPARDALNTKRRPCPSGTSSPPALFPPLSFEKVTISGEREEKLRNLTEHNY